MPLSYVYIYGIIYFNQVTSYMAQRSGTKKIGAEVIARALKCVAGGGWGR